MTNSPDANTPPQPLQEPLIAEIMGLLSKATEQFAPGDNEMKQWMLQNFHNTLIVEILQEATLMMLRVLDAIGRLEPVNGITISRQARIPKGSVSKISRRLIAKKLISAEPLPNNKKEILFRLTPLGRELFLAHQAFDQQMERGFFQFLQKYDADELSFIVRMLKDLTETSFISLGDRDTNK